MISNLSEIFSVYSRDLGRRYHRNLDGERWVRLTVTNWRCCSASKERIKNRVTDKGEHLDEASRQLFGEHRDMSFLSYAGKIPVHGKICIPVFLRYHGTLFPFSCRLWRAALLFEQQYEFVIEF